MKDDILRILLVVTVALNVLTGSYYLWSATTDGILSRSTLTGDAFPFAALYFGRLLTPILSALTLVLASRHRSGV